METRNYDGKKLTVDTSMKKGGEYVGYLEGEKVTIDPRIFGQLPKWAGRPLLPPEAKRVRHWVSLKPSVWEYIESLPGTRSQAIEEIIKQHMDQ